MTVRGGFLQSCRAGVAMIVAGALASCALAPVDEEAELQRRVVELQAQLDEARAALATSRARRQPFKESSSSALAATHPVALYEQALASEAQGRYAEATRLYRLSARQGNGKAAQRLGLIYGKRLPDADPNYAESLKWCYTARALGEEPNCAAR